MKRSEINQIIRNGIGFLEQYRLRLPPFAFWSPADWTRKGPECAAIVRHGLGWDITDFGSGDFAKMGLFLFTVRNGAAADIGKPGTKTYAEKVMIVQEGQVTPTHFHFHKMEDIINRGGGELVIQLWKSTADQKLSQEDAVVSVDGVARRVTAGGEVVLKPGESICLEQGIYHKFWGGKGKGTVLVGEVSMVNDDDKDNRFLEPVGRFPAIDEDEVPLHLLCKDYARYYRNV